jgi:hypothetical protein
MSLPQSREEEGRCGASCCAREKEQRARRPPWLGRGAEGNAGADSHVEGGVELLVSTWSHVGRMVPWIRARGACSKGLGQRPSREVEAPWTGSVSRGRKKTAWGGRERLLATVVSLGVGVQNCQVQGERAPIYRHGLGLVFLSGPNGLEWAWPKTLNHAALNYFQSKNAPAEFVATKK